MLVFNLWFNLDQVQTKSWDLYKKKKVCFVSNLEEVEGPDFLHSSNSCPSHTRWSETHSCTRKFSVTKGFVFAETLNYWGISVENGQVDEKV